ncbi:unnamed protein product [Leuciscus chuanchicus]
MRLIGPQLKEPVTRMETHNTFAEVAVTRNQTPPSGRVTLSTDSAFFNTSWETVLGKSYADLSKLKQIRSFTVTAVAQLCVLGGTWVFGFFLFQENGTEVMLYLFTILNSLQGVLIFIMHCLLSKQVRTEYYNLFGRMCPHKKKAEYRVSQSNSSQKPLRSDGSTAESQM